MAKGTKVQETEKKEIRFTDKLESPRYFNINGFHLDIEKIENGIMYIECMIGTYLPKYYWELENLFSSKTLIAYISRRTRVNQDSINAIQLEVNGIKFQLSLAEGITRKNLQKAFERARLEEVWTKDQKLIEDFKNGFLDIGKEKKINQYNKWKERRKRLKNLIKLKSEFLPFSFKCDKHRMLFANELYQNVFTEQDEAYVDEIIDNAVILGKYLEYVMFRDGVKLEKIATNIVDCLTYDLTGDMYVNVMRLLVKYWKYGSELKYWYYLDHEGIEYTPVLFKESSEEILDRI